jgi:YD repeat-containing protein
VVDTTYDGRGLVAKTSTFWNNASGPATTLVAFSDTDVRNQHRHSYDNQNRSTVDALWTANVLQYQTTTTYDGDRTTVTPPAGGDPTTTITTARGQTSEIRQFLTPSTAGSYQATTYGHDPLGRLTELHDPAGNHWTWTNDPRGRVAATTDPDRGATTLVYDDAGQLVTTTDARNASLTYTYDALGRKTAVYDGVGTAGSKRAAWTYDTLAIGQPTSSARFDSAGNAYTQTVTGYDDGYRPLGTTVTIPAVNGLPSGSYTETMAYNVDGSVASITYPAVGGLAAETVSNTYDATGNLLTVAGQDTYVSATTYSAFGPVNQRILGSGTARVLTTSTVDEATGRLTDTVAETENPASPGSWVEARTEHYGYDNAGDVTSIRETAGGATVGDQCFGYDGLDRLTEAWTTSASACQSAPSQAVVGGTAPYWTSYRYSTAGTRSTETRHASAGDLVRTYAYPAAGSARPHAVTSVTSSGAATGTDTYAYDAVGATTTRALAGKPSQTLTWDSEGRLSTVVDSTGTSSYVYDADGDRLVARDPQGATVYLPNLEIRKVGSTVTATRYVDAGGTAVAVRTTSGGLYWLAGDNHGTAELAIKAAGLPVTGRRMGPFGEVRGTDPAWPTNHGFVDGVRDTTGLT